MPPSILAVRSAYSASNFGDTNFLMTKKRSRNATRPRMISEVCGRTGLTGPSAATMRVFITDSPNAIRIRSGSRDEVHDEADQREDLDDGEGGPRQAEQHAAGLGLTGGAADDRGEDQTHADARADGREAVADGRETLVQVDGVLGDLDSAHCCCSLSNSVREISRIGGFAFLSALLPAPCRCSWQTAARRCRPAGT